MNYNMYKYMEKYVLRSLKWGFRALLVKVLGRILAQKEKTAKAQPYIDKTSQKVKGDTMAAKPKETQKVRLDYNITKEIYDDFVRMTSKKGFAPAVVVEKMMKKYVDTQGQI